MYFIFFLCTYLHIKVHIVSVHIRFEFFFSEDLEDAFVGNRNMNGNIKRFLVIITVRLPSKIGHRFNSRVAFPITTLTAAWL